MTEEKDVVIHVRIPRGVIEKIDRLVKKGLFMNRSSFVRFAITVVAEEYAKSKE